MVLTTQSMPAAIVTGAGRGLGRVIAQQLAADEYGLVVNDIDGQIVRETAASSREAGGDLHDPPGPWLRVDDDENLILGDA